MIVPGRDGLPRVFIALAKARRILVGIALILVLTATAALVAPKFIKLAPLREQLVTQLSAQLHAKVDLASLHVSLFPLPHLMLDKLRLSVAPTLDATIESAAVYPRLLPLLTGNVQLGQVSVAGASVQMRLPSGWAIESTTDNAIATRGLREMLAAGLAMVSSVAARAPDLAVRLTHGALNVTTAEGEAFAFTDIQGDIDLPLGRLSIDLASGSNMWEQATLRAAMDPASVNGDGRIMLTGLRAQVISRYLMPADLEIGNATADLDVHLTADGLDALRADVEATARTIDIFEGSNDSRLSEVREGSPEPPTGVAGRKGAGRSPPRAGKHLKLEGAHVNATVKIDEQTTGVTFNEVRLAAPPLQLFGTLMLDRRTPQVRLQLDSKDLDVANAHEAAVFFATNNLTAQAIFRILRAGKVPQLKIQGQGRTPGELGLEAMLVRGTLVGGQVRIPGNGLELEDVNCEVSVAKGVLIGEHASARLGNTQARDGSVRIGLTDESHELSVTTTVQADASDLSAVLSRVVTNETLPRTLDRLTEVQGRAKGQLTLRGTTDAPTAAAEVSTLSVSAKVRDFDRPVRIEGGTLHYDANGVAASGLKITTGDSFLSEVSVRADTSAALASIEVIGGSGRIALGETYRLVATSGWLPSSVWAPKTLSGTFALKSVRVRGPAATPSDWRIETTGAVERLDFDAPRLRQVVNIRFPVTLSDLRLVHDSGANTLAASVAAADGLTGNLDLRWGAEGLDIKRLSVRDAESNATLSLRLKEREFDATFAGTLRSATLKALLPNEHNVAGSMRGEFSARVLLDQPALSTAKGRLEVAHVAVPGPGDLRAHIARAELRATGGSLAIDAEGEVSDGLLLHLHGSLRPAVDAFIADLDVSTGLVEWARLEPLLLAWHDDGKSTPTASHPMPVRGKVRISADSFTYAGYTWKPVRAVVDLSGGTPSITITQASLCRISTPGTMAMTPGGTSVRFKPMAKNQRLEQMLSCLTGKPARMTGKSSLIAQIDAAGPGPEIIASAKGQVRFTTRNGRIYQTGVLEKVLAVISVGYGSWNILSDLTDDGLPYNTIDAKGDLREGKLVLTEATMDAPSMKMVAEGTVDVMRGTIDVTLLAAPLKTADSVVSRIPVFGNVVGGSLLTIPVKVKGPLQDPSVTPLDPSEVGNGLLRVMTRIVKLPLRLLDPFLPGSGKPY